MYEHLSRSGSYYSDGLEHFINYYQENDFPNGDEISGANNMLVTGDGVRHTTIDDIKAPQIQKLIQLILTRHKQ